MIDPNAFDFRATLSVLDMLAQRLQEPHPPTVLVGTQWHRRRITRRLAALFGGSPV